MKTKHLLKRTILPATMLVAALLVMLNTSCVSNKKYQSAVSESDRLKADNQKLTNQIQSMNKEQAQYRQQCEVTTSQYQALRSAMDEEEKTLQSVQKKLEAGLTDFMNRGLEVEYKNGLLYVDMEDNLMYKSGSAEIGEQGKEALKALANALNDYPKLKVIVVGHADTVMYKGNTKDNWTLSTERANGVVRVLRDNQVDPTRLTAAGRGKFDPVADNSTPEGRAKNRRTEIVLRADMDRIWKESAAGK